MFKYSSQFTDYVLTHSTNPDTILKQVGDAIESLKDSDYPIPNPDMIATFHEDVSVTDDFLLNEILSSLNSYKKNRIVNNMYQILSALERTGKIDKYTQKHIEKFLNTEWNKLPEEDPESKNVIRRRKEDKPQENELKIEMRDSSPSWQAIEDRLINKLDSDREFDPITSSSKAMFDSLEKVGILDYYPSMEERNLRLIERKYQWIDILSK